jgi:hypothetical protein
MQKMVQDELDRREERMEQLSEVRKSIESAVKRFGLAAEEVLEIFRFGPAKKAAKRRGRPPSKKTAAKKAAAKRRGRPPSKKAATAKVAKVTKVAKKAAKKVAKTANKNVSAKKAATKATKKLSSSARSQAMKDAWARRKAAAVAAAE